MRADFGCVPRQDAAVAYTCPIGEFPPQIPLSPLDNREILKSGGYAEPMEVRATLRKGWSLKRVRRTLAQGTVGKGIAIMLGIW
jgi:hypothetical protein